MACPGSECVLWVLMHGVASQLAPRPCRRVKCEITILVSLIPVSFHPCNLFITLQDAVLQEGTQPKRSFQRPLLLGTWGLQNNELINSTSIFYTITKMGLDTCFAQIYITSVSLHSLYSLRHWLRLLAEGTACYMHWGPSQNLESALILKRADGV